jgi:hypothetical protein
VDKRKHFSIGYFVAAALLLLGLQTLVSSTQVETLVYSDFKALLHAGRMREVIIRTDTLAGTADVRDAGSLPPPGLLAAVPEKTLASYPFMTARSGRNPGRGAASRQGPILGTTRKPLAVDVTELGHSITDFLWHLGLRDAPHEFRATRRCHGDRQRQSEVVRTEVDRRDVRGRGGNR